METNLRAPVVLMQRFAARLPAENDGVIVNILDQRVWNPTEDFLSYTVTKTALLGLTRTLALDLAPRIRVCGVGPGPTLRSEEHTSELQSLMRISYAVFCLQKKNNNKQQL